MSSKLESFIGKVKAEEGLLLGGVVNHRSARFSEFKQAVRWCDIVIAENKEAGRKPLFDGIEASTLAPEIE